MPPATKKSYSRNPVLDSPYSLFGIPVSNSPPTPLDAKSRKAAARRRCQKKLAQPVIQAEKVNSTRSSLVSEVKDATGHPLMTECRVVLERLDLVSLTPEARLDENSNPNVRNDPLRAPKAIPRAPGLGQDSDGLRCVSGDHPMNNLCRSENDFAIRGSFSPLIVTTLSGIEPPLPPSMTQSPVSEAGPSASSEESDADCASDVSDESNLDATIRSRSNTKIFGRRKLSRPCYETSHLQSTPQLPRSVTTLVPETTADKSTLLSSTNLSVLRERRSLASINNTTSVESTTPRLRRRRSETQFSEFYSSALRNAGQLQVVAERMSWLRLTPLIMPEYPIDFVYIFKNWSMEIVSKLGEGSFSEVYRVRRRFDPENDFDVFKVIPVGQPGQPTFDDMLPEMSMCLAGRCLLESPRNRAPSFLSLRGTHLVQGTLTKEMVSAYEAFRELNPGETEQPHPSARQPNQFYVVFYTSYDGCELETELPRLSGNMRASIVLQITYALAAAELSFEFEHRDLHLSNIVIKDSDDPELEFRICGKSFGIKSFGKRAALIDYGMCRLVVDEVLHSPFEPEILVGPGLQRRTYREQHRMLEGDYHTRCLETNGLWISFLIKKLFPKRPVNSKLFYGAKLNRLYSELCENRLSARQCVQILENCELNDTQISIL